MNLLQMAGVALAAAIAGPASADLLTPIDQLRFVEGYASWWDYSGEGSDYGYLEAVGFELFDEHLVVYCGGGEGVADQLSEIGADGIVADGFASGFGYGAVHQGSSGSGGSEMNVTFSVDGWTFVTLSGSLSFNNECEPGGSIVSLSLTSLGQPLVEMYEETGFGTGSFPIDEGLWLEAGVYVISVRCSSSSIGFEGGGLCQSQFEFEMNLVLEEPCAADCFPGGGDGVVDVLDLIFVLAEWGSTSSPADIAPHGGDGIVNVHDLLLVLGQWGPCE